jgi:hypothetical protein
LASFGQALASFEEHWASFEEHLASFGEHSASFEEHLTFFGEHLASFDTRVYRAGVMCEFCHLPVLLTGLDAPSVLADKVLKEYAALGEAICTACGVCLTQCECVKDQHKDKETAGKTNDPSL